MKEGSKIFSNEYMTILDSRLSPARSNSFKVLIDMVHQNLKPFGISDFIVSAALRFRPALLNTAWLRPFGNFTGQALLNSRFARRQSRFNRVNHCGVLNVRLIPESSRAFHLPQTRKPLNLGFFSFVINQLAI